MDTFRLTFDRTLAPSDSKKNLPFPVQVPAGTTQFNIHLTFAPWKVDPINNMLTLSVFDPAGFRGAGHRHGSDHRVILNRQVATPGYCAGAIPPGEWLVTIDTHMIYGGPCSLRLEVWGTDDAVEGTAPRWEASVTPPRGRGWYRGDLHAHTLHSDAAWDVPELVAWARRHRLDFCTLSDHNTVSALAQMDAQRQNELLTLGGMELTTFWGHALALGMREWVDWRTRDGHAMPEIAAEVVERGGTFIIAHPRSLGDPYCTGCRWVYSDMMPGSARIVEAWNGPWVGDGSSRNEDSLNLIFRWLNEGYRLALTAGTDHHGSEFELNSQHGFNVVYADALTEPEILRAIRAGHSYLSAGPQLELRAAAGEQRAMMGDALDMAGDSPVRIEASWGNGVPDAELTLVVDGEAQERARVGADGTRSWDLPASQARWCLLTLRAPDGSMLALTNPIFLDGRAW